MTPRITGFSNLRGRFEPMPFDDAMAVRVETIDQTLKINEYGMQFSSAFNAPNEAWFMFRDMAQ